MAPLRTGRCLARLPILLAKMLIGMPEQLLVVNPAGALNTVATAGDAVPVGGFAGHVADTVQGNIVKRVIVKQ